MADILFKNFKIFDGEKFIEADSLLVSGSEVVELGCGENTEADEVIDGNGRILSPGFIDLHAHFRDPGLEWNEDMVSGSMAGAAGGFTTMVAMPNTKPAISDPPLVRYVKTKGETVSGARILPSGTVSKERKGEELAELHKMAEEGAVLFTDDGSPVSTGDLLRLALRYTGEELPVIMEHPEEQSLFRGGQVHEGRVSALSGLRGIPVASEVIDVARGIALVKEFGGRIHFTHLSAGESVKMIREAKKEGLNVTCDTTFHHLTLTENAVIASGYNARYKVNPPLRSAEDRDALWEGLSDGTIDAIVTDHAPWHMDEKDQPFQEAPFGIASLECAAAVLIDFLKANKPEFTLETVLRKMTGEPAKILPREWQNLGKLCEGSRADITVLDEEKTKIIDCTLWNSKARCCPWEGMAVTCWPVMTFVGGRKVWSDDEELG